MKCNICKKETECYVTTVYYAEVKSRNTANDHDITKMRSTATTVTQYGAIERNDYKICPDCAVAMKKRKTQKRPLYAFITLASFGLVVKLIELFSGSDSGDLNINGIYYVLIGLFSIFLLSSIIGLARKKYKKIRKSDSYFLAVKMMKKELKKKLKKTEFEFWHEYPSHLMQNKR